MWLAVFQAQNVLFQFIVLNSFDLQQSFKCFLFQETTHSLQVSLHWKNFFEWSSMFLPQRVLNHSLGWRPTCTAAKQTFVTFALSIHKFPFESVSCPKVKVRTLLQHKGICSPYMPSVFHCDQLWSQRKPDSVWPVWWMLFLSRDTYWSWFGRLNIFQV